MSDLIRKVERFGIINPYGGIWTPNTFDTPEDAARYVSNYWKSDAEKIKGFKVVLVSVTVVAEEDGPPASEFLS
jgi:hypothetical protein